MNVLLLEHPRTITNDRANDIANTPLASCLLSGYAAAALKKEGHGVEIVEGFLDGLSYEDMWKTVAGAKPDILAVHMVYHWRKDLRLFDFLETVKREIGPSHYRLRLLSHGRLRGYPGELRGHRLGDRGGAGIDLSCRLAGSHARPIPGLASRAAFGRRH